MQKFVQRKIFFLSVGYLSDETETIQDGLVICIHVGNSIQLSFWNLIKLGKIEQ
jgi:hypothetical protein